MENHDRVLWIRNSDCECVWNPNEARGGLESTHFNSRIFLNLFLQEYTEILLGEVGKPDIEGIWEMDVVPVDISYT